MDMYLSSDKIMNSVFKIKNYVMKIKIGLILVFAQLIICAAYGQQDVQYTQFMHNKTALNAGYAGSTGVPCLNALYRNQWSGFEGAPISQSLSFQMPVFKDRVGLGMTMVHDKLGPSESWKVAMMYSYHIDLGKAKLGVGLQGSLQNYRVRWDQTDATQANDLLIPDNASSSRFIPNFGAGLYLHSENYYVGLSVPHLLKSELSFVERQFRVEGINKAEVHAFLMGGIIFKVNNMLRIKPAGLIKYVKNAPLDFDLHTSLIFYDQFWLGATYRAGGDLLSNAGESIDAIVQLQLNEAIRVGFAYDFTLTEIKDYTAGSFEILLDYCFHYNGKRLTNPRFF